MDADSPYVVLGALWKTPTKVITIQKLLRDKSTRTKNLARKLRAYCWEPERTQGSWYTKMLSLVAVIDESVGVFRDYIVTFR